MRCPHTKQLFTTMFPVLQAELQLTLGVILCRDVQRDFTGELGRFTPCFIDVVLLGTCHNLLRRSLAWVCAGFMQAAMKH